jgi:hypothetical protein
VHAKFPLHGLRFKNTSGLHLMQGPITVFDGSSYAGDARIQDLQPNEDRLLSYAIDLGTEVEPLVETAGDRITKIKLHKGILYATHKLREKKTYNIKNRGDQDRTLIIEHPFRENFKLVTPKEAKERSREVYRFEVQVAAGKTAQQEVLEEQDQVQEVAISNSDDDTIRYFLRSSEISEKAKAALEKAVAWKTKLGDTQRQLAHEQAQLKEITEDQGRLRANLREMPPTAVAYKRYLEKFDKQESEIESLQAKIKTLQQGEQEQKKEYENYLMALDVE